MNEMQHTPANVLVRLYIIFVNIETSTYQSLADEINGKMLAQVIRLAFKSY